MQHWRAVWWYAGTISCNSSVTGSCCIRTYCSLGAGNSEGGSPVKYTNVLQIGWDCLQVPVGLSLINHVIWAQEQMLEILQDIRLAQRLSEMAIETRLEEVRMHEILEGDLEGDLGS